MPHIHTQPDQHDMTVSAYIVRQIDNVWHCMVHFHKKLDVYMQVGGHMELNETPWQALAHELEEESGYTLDELQLVQPSKNAVQTKGNITHPVPFSMNTHNVGNQHYHSDLCYGFVAENLPENETADGESDNMQWLTLSELHGSVKRGETLADVEATYTFLLDNLDTYVQVPANSYSLDKPTNKGVVYKRGAPGEV